MTAGGHQQGTDKGRDEDQGGLEEDRGKGDPEHGGEGGEEPDPQLGVEAQGGGQNLAGEPETHETAESETPHGHRQLLG